MWKPIRRQLGSRIIEDAACCEVLASLGSDLDARRFLHFLPSLPTMAREGQDLGVDEILHYLYPKPRG